MSRPERQFDLNGNSPQIEGGSWVAPDVFLLGDVQVLADANVWSGSVLRAGGDRIVLGERSNVQNGCVIYADPALPVTIGEEVSIGHRAVVHGCTIGSWSLIGMSATVLNGAEIGSGSIVAAGTVILEGMVIPSSSLVAGVPGKVRRHTTKDEMAAIVTNADRYCALKALHEALRGHAGNETSSTNGHRDTSR